MRRTDSGFENYSMSRNALSSSPKFFNNGSMHIKSAHEVRRTVLSLMIFLPSPSAVRPMTVLEII